MDPSTPGLAPCQVQIPWRVDVHQQEVGVPETSQLVPYVLDLADPFQKPAHGPRPAVERRPETW